MNTIRLCVVACACVMASALAPAPVFGETSAPAGHIKISSGDAVILRSGRTIPAPVGETVYVSDSVRTGKNGRIGITLADDTLVSVGPASELHLDAFAFNPAQGNLALAIKLLKGAAVYVSGRIAKLAPDTVRLETPAAIVGVRGTTVALRADATP